MRKATFSGFLILLIVILSIINSGCWSRREIEDLGFIGSIAIDQADDPKLLEVTAQFISSEALTAGSEGGMGGAGGRGKKIWLVSAKGSTVFEALFKINPWSAKHLFFGHLSSIIIGEKVARRGIPELLDSFDRMPQLRRNIWVLIAPDRAKSVLQAQPKFIEIPSLVIEGIFSHIGTTSMSYPSNLNNLLIMLSSRSTDPIVARVKTIFDEEMPNSQQAEINGELGRKEIDISGSAIFKKDRLIGWLEGKETRGVLWVQDKMKRGTITFRNTRGNHKFVTFEVLDSKRRIKTFMKGGILHVNLKILLDGNLVEQTSNRDILSMELLNEKENVQGFYSAINYKVKEEIVAAIEKTQKYKVDVFGIGERFYIQHPQEFKKLQKKWPDIYANAKFSITINGRVRRVGLINRSINAQTQQ